MLLFDTVTVLTRLMSTMVFTREAQRAVGAGWAKAVEPVDFVLAGSPAQTWI